MEMPALLTMMSIWKLPVEGSAKWFFAVAIRWAGPVREPISAWTTKHRMPCSEVRDSESLLVKLAEDSEV